MAPLPITGQVLLRACGSAPTADNRTLVMVLGVIAVPAGWELKTEHQYTVVGPDDGSCSLTLLPDSGIDRSSETYGSSVGQILKMPIWRV